MDDYGVCHDAQLAHDYFSVEHIYLEREEDEFPEGEDWTQEWDDDYEDFEDYEDYEDKKETEPEPTSKEIDWGEDLIDLRDAPTEGEEGDNEIDWDAQLIDLRDTTATEVAKVSDLAQAGALRA